MTMNRLSIPAVLIVSVLLGLATAIPISVFAEPGVAPIEPPTKAAFDAEVKAIQERATKLESDADLLDDSYQQMRDTYRALIDSQRERRTEFREASQVYHAAWDQVRQLLMAGKAGDALANAVEEAQAQDAVYQPKRERYAEQSAALDQRVGEMRAKQDEAS